MNFFELKRKQNNLPDPESPFIFSKGKTITYSEFNNKVEMVENYFLTESIKNGEYTAILLENNPDFITTVFALWEIGAVPVPVNVRLNHNEIRNIIEFCDAKFLITDKMFDGKLLSPDVKILKTPIGLSDDKQSDKKKSRYNLTDTAVIIFTSGSTGFPKGVMLSFNNLIQSNEIGNQVLNQNSEDRWLASLPFYHIGGFSIIMRAFLSNSSISIPPSLKTEDLISSINNQKPTLTSFVSTQLQRLLNENCNPNPELKKVLLGGGFSNEDLCRNALNKDWNIIKVYGSSEVSSFVSAVDLKIHKDKINSSGRALTSNEIKIVNDAGNILSSNKRGEIIVKSETVMKGYLKNKTESNKKLRNGYYHTGDTGFLDDDGYLYVEARRTDLIVSGGENINPAEVENIIMSFGLISDVYVFPMNDKEWGQIAVAAIVVKKNYNLTIDNLIKFLKSKLAGFKIPKKFYIVEILPRTELGKIQKDKLIKTITKE